MKPTTQSEGLNGLDLLLMCELKENPGGLTGYDLFSILPNTSHQQIYRQLTKLKKLRYVDFEEVAQDGKPDKKIYTIARGELSDKFFDYCIFHLRANRNSTVNSIEGVYRSIQYASPKIVINWCEQLIKSLIEEIKECESNKMRLDSVLDSVKIDYLNMIIKIAKIRARKEKKQARFG